MINPRMLLFSVVLALVAVNSASATSYFVTQSGAGSQNGLSLANAWSVANFNASSAPTGGDTVFFSGSITTQVGAKSGTGNGASRLTLDFTSATLSVSGTDILISGDNYVTITGGKIATDAAGAFNNLIACNTSVAHDITIQNWTYVGSTNGTSSFYSVGKCNTVLIENNSADNVSHCVTAWQGATHDITILNNYCRTSSNTTQQSDVITLGDTTNVMIQGNKLINRAPGSQNNSRHNDVIQTYQGGGADNQAPSNWTIRYNWLEEAVADCGNTDGSNSWTMIESTTGTNYEYGNVFYTASPCNFGNGATMDSNNPAAVWNVNNNTYFGASGYPGIWFQNSGHLNTSENNAFQLTNSNGNTNLIFNWTNGTLDYNHFSGISGCDASIVGTHGTCTATLPLFKDAANGDLSPTATLQGKGNSNIGSQFNQGICPGATWPNPTLCARTVGAWDVGAYQSGDGGLTPPTGLAAAVR